MGSLLRCDLELVLATLLLRAFNFVGLYFTINGCNLNIYIYQYAAHVLFCFFFSEPQPTPFSYFYRSMLLWIAQSSSEKSLLSLFTFIWSINDDVSFIAIKITLAFRLCKKVFYFHLKNIQDYILDISSPVLCALYLKMFTKILNLFQAF